MAQLGKIAFRLRNLGLKKLIFLFLKQDCTRISNVEDEESFVVDEDSNEGGASEFSVDLTFKKLSVGGTESQVDDFNHLLLFRSIVKLLQRTDKVFSL